jgi:hypothetical protein
MLCYSYLLGRVHKAMIWIIKHSLTQVIWRYIILYILWIIHICVMYVTRQSVTGVFQWDFPSHIVTRIQNPLVCGSHSLWCIGFVIITVYICGVSASREFKKKKFHCVVMYFHACSAWCILSIGSIYCRILSISVLQVSSNDGLLLCKLCVCKYL